MFNSCCCPINVFLFKSEVIMLLKRHFMRHWDYRKKIAQIETVKAPLRGWVGKKGWTTQCPVSYLDRLLTSIAIIFTSSGTLFMYMWGENNSCLVRKWRISQSIWDPLVACASKTWVRDKAAIKSTTTAVFSLAPHWAEVAASCIHKLPTGWEVRKKWCGNTMTSTAEAIFLFSPVVWTSDAPGKGDILVTSKISLVIVPL